MTVAPRENGEHGEERDGEGEAQVTLLPARRLGDGLCLGRIFGARKMGQERRYGRAAWGASGSLVFSPVLV
jgi:hypothetical protein